MYKDPNRQKEANRKAQAGFKAKGITEGIIQQGITGVILKGITEEEYQAANKPKRGKDIKCFEDLPPDVQQTIRRVSDTNEEFKRRAGIAIRYQHLFPDRYHSVGVVI